MCAQVAGWVGIWVALVAFYAATAILTGEVWDHVRPLNPPIGFDPLPHLKLCIGAMRL